MILFVPAQDEATQANLSVVTAWPEEERAGALLASSACRERLQQALRGSPEALLFAMCHGTHDAFWGHDEAAALTAADVSLLTTRLSYAFACHTAEGLGQAVGRAGGYWWGYTGAIPAPGTLPEEVPIFARLFLEIRANLQTSPEQLQTTIFALTEDAAAELDRLLADFSSYYCLLCVWDRLRLISPGGAVWQHPRSGSPQWMT